MKAVLVAAALLACTPRVLPPAAALEETCFSGEEKVFLPQGREVAKYELLIQRFTDPASRTVAEYVLKIEPPKKPMPISLVYDVSGNALKLRQGTGVTASEGELFGTPWKWNGWRTVSTIAGGGKVESVDRFEGAALRVEKTLFGPGGEVRVRFGGLFRVLDATECRERHRAAGLTPRKWTDAAR